MAPSISASHAALDGLKSLEFQVCVGWLTGFEPATTGITIQDSTVELQPPLKIWPARQDSNL